MAERASILLVDDEKRFAEATARLLRVEGFSVEVAFSGSKALEIYQSKDRQFDIVITDLKMPIMDGIELIRLIRQIKPDQSIIVITAFSAQCAPWNRRLAADQTEPEPPGSLDYLIKPFSLRQLLDVIDKSLKGEHFVEEREFSDGPKSHTIAELSKRTEAPQEQAKVSSTDLSSVGAKLILEEAAREFEGSVVCALVSIDGVSRVEVNPGGFPMEYYSGKFSLLAYLMRNTLIEIGSGDLKEFFLQLESGSIYAKFISSGKYYLCIITQPHAPLGALIATAARAAERLAKIVS